MSSTVAEQYVINLEDGQAAVIAESEEARELLRRRLAESDKVQARVALRDTGDTEGHSAASNVVAITLDLDDDTEGHALSLRFPTAEAARDFEKRMLTTGLLVGTIAATAIGVGVGVGVQNITSQAAPAPIVQTAPTVRDMDRDISAPIVQTAPTVRDTDRTITIPQTAPTVRDTDRNITTPQTAPTVRDTDRDLSDPATPVNINDRMHAE
jgi:hypothetical protein